MFVKQYFQHRTYTECVHVLPFELTPIFGFEHSNIELRTLFDPSQLEIIFFNFSYREDHEFEFEYEDWGVIEESAVSPRIL